MRRRWWVLISGVALIAVAVPVVFVAQIAITNAVGRVTAEDGRTIYWRDYPGVSGLDSQAVLAGPTAEQALREGGEMVTQMREAITAEFALRWVDAPPGASSGPSFSNAQNGFGGNSMLTTINAPTSQTTSVPGTWTDKQRIIQIIGEIAAAHGYLAPVLDHERPGVTEADRARDFGGTSPATQVFISGFIEGPVGQWLSFGLQDPALDVDGRFAGRLSGEGWEAASVTLSYGANALLPAGDRAEFERRLEPFNGLPLPKPLED